MLEHKPVGEASHVSSPPCAEILPGYWEKRSTERTKQETREAQNKRSTKEKQRHEHGIDFPEVQHCLIPGIPEGQAANGFLCAFLTALPLLWAPHSVPF